MLQEELKLPLSVNQKNKEGRVAIILPAYNEAKSIKRVIEELQRHNPGNWDIIVVNDYSKDNTFSEAKKLVKEVISLPFNLGIGGCVQCGLLYARRKGYERAIQFDSDGQHVASEIKTLLWAMDQTNSDVVIGSRFITNFDNQFRSSFLRRVGIKAIRATTKLLTGKKITDPTSGFRAFNKRVIELFSENYPVHYPEPESLILLHKNKFAVHEVSTLMLPRTDGSSSIQQKAIFYMLNVLLGMLVSSIRPQKK